ncbi:MAG: hypothetical protein AB7M12_00635 [Hyphomonadaceae bacterium]
MATLTIVDLAAAALRLMGVLWVVGGLMLMRELRRNAQLDSIIETLDKLAEDASRPNAPDWADAGRDRWLFAGGVLTIASGVAMALASRFAVPLLAGSIVHQLLYFVRQRRRELRAPTPEAAAAERPTAHTVNGFFMALAMAVLAAWLYHAGRLH